MDGACCTVHPHRGPPCTPGCGDPTRSGQHRPDARARRESARHYPRPGDRLPPQGGTPTSIIQRHRRPARPQLHTVLSGSWRISRRGRCAGSGWRLDCSLTFLSLPVLLAEARSISPVTSAMSPSRVSSSRLFCSALRPALTSRSWPIPHRRRPALIADSTKQADGTNFAEYDFVYP